jgi:hypothetical protein
MVIGLLRGMRRSDSQYLAGTIREAKFTSLGYETRLSSPHPPPLPLAFPRSSHSKTRDPKQENNQGTQGRSHVPQAGPPTLRLHNSDQKRDREKVIDRMRVKIHKNKYKTEAQFYQYNYTQGETENS